MTLSSDSDPDSTESTDSVAHFGARIAKLRKIHGLTQEGLALRVNLSYSMIRKIERGERTASQSLIAAVARTLRVNVFDITEQPYGTRTANVAAEQSGVPFLRQALVEGDDPDPDTPLLALDDLRPLVSRLKELDRRGAHSEAVRDLPDLLKKLHLLRWQEGADSQSDVNELLAESYGYAVVALYRLGHLDLAHLADERARAAAAKGLDPVRAAVAEWHHALILLFDGAYSAGTRTLDRAESFVEEAPAGAASTAVRGAIQLRRAVLAARQADAGMANAALLDAGRFVEQGQDAANYYGTKFSGGNLAIHQVSVPVELADGVVAVTRASRIHIPDSIAPSRRGHYWIDLAQGWFLYGNRAKSLDALQQARRIAPQVTRYHPQVHETVHALAARDSRATSSLHEFAAWCGAKH
ncbi:MAG: helix-turn-helix transcriptional regulator [Pseudonocardia sp.]